VERRGGGAGKMSHAIGVIPLEEERMEGQRERENLPIDKGWCGEGRNRNLQSRP